MSDSWRPTPEQQPGDTPESPHAPQPHPPQPQPYPQQPYPQQPYPQYPYTAPASALSSWVPPPHAPKPGVIPLRPLGVAELLDGAITAIRRYPKAILLPSFVVALGLGAFSFLVQLASLGFLTELNDLESGVNTGTVDGGDLARVAGPTLALSLVAVLVQFIATVLLTGVITVVMSQAVLGRPMDATQAWRRIKPQAWRLIGLSLMVTLIGIGVSVAAVLLVVIFGVLTAGIGLILLLFVWIPAAVVLTYVAVAPAALLLERSGVFASISRAWSLTSSAFWRTFGTLVLMVIIYMVISVAISLPFSAPELVAPSIDPVNSQVDETRFVINSAISTIGSVIVSTVALPNSSLNCSHAQVLARSHQLGWASA